MVVGLAKLIVIQANNVDLITPRTGQPLVTGMAFVAEPTAAANMFYLSHIPEMTVPAGDVLEAVSLTEAATTRMLVHIPDLAAAGVQNVLTADQTRYLQNSLDMVPNRNAIDELFEAFLQARTRHRRACMRAHAVCVWDCA